MTIRIGRAGAVLFGAIGLCACSPGGSAGKQAAQGTGNENPAESGGTGGNSPAPFAGGEGGGNLIGNIDVGGGGAGGSGGLPDDVCESIPVRPEIFEVEVQVPIEVPIQVPIEVPVEVQVPVTTVEEHPVALYIMLDRSTSMVGALWQNAVSSLTTFVNDPASSGLQVALQYFPIDGADYGFGLPGPACTDPNGAPHNTPVVPMAPLPGNAQPIITSLTNTLPAALGLTPTEPAVRGLENYCASWQAQNPDWTCVSVLVTDGDPTICNVDPTFISNIAGNAYTSNGTMTFTVGMGDVNFATLDQIATAGHGDCDPNAAGYQACDVRSGPTAFIAALQQIRQTVTTTYTTEYRTEVQYVTEYETQYETQIQTQRTPLECEYGIPNPPEGETFDKNKVNVKVTLASGSTQSIGQVPSEADCESSTSGGWYYDNPDEPTRVLICPSTCTVLEADASPTIDILLGCETEPAILR